MELGTTTEFEKRYQKLNREQKRAVDILEGPLLIIAGPGTGKTELLGVRTANILLKTDTNPEEILILTFTESAAQNMQERLFEIIGRVAYRVQVFTFHSLANSIIQQYGEYFYENAEREPISELRKTEIFERIFSQMKFGDPLYGYNEARGYRYLKPTINTIRKVKEFGLKAGDYQDLIDKTESEYIEVDKIIQKSWPTGKRSIALKEEYLKVALALTKLTGNETAHFLAHDLEKKISQDLDENETNGTKKSDHIFEFIKKNIFVNKKRSTVSFTGIREISKMQAFAKVYAEYESEMTRLGFYDYADMILDVLYALRNNEDLLAQLETKYQYVMLDEFQDTNQAQLELANLILYKGPENRPNICAVGDDDQGIYKFQGAEINNLLKFYNAYQGTSLVNLIENYRSNDNILDISRSIIEQVEERFETTLKDEQGNLQLKKKLNSQNSHPHTEPVFLAFSSEELEYTYLAQKIKNLIESGVSPKEIAILSKKHVSLQTLIPFLDHFEVPYSYEKETTLLENENIVAIINLCKVVANLETDSEEVEYLLPSVLSSPFFSVSRATIWQIAARARELKKSWLTIILEDKEFSEIRTRLEEYINLKNKYDLINFIYAIIDPKFSDYKKYYFSQEYLLQKEISYFKELEAIKTLISSLSEWAEKRVLRVKDLAEFLRYAENLDEPIKSTVKITNSLEHISLMTVYKAKGLEWEYVFVTDLDNNTWSAKGHGGAYIPLPRVEEGEIERLQTDKGDVARALFVAITRAKFGLTLTTAGTWSALISDNPSLQGKLQDFSETVPKETYKNLEVEAREIIFANQTYENLSERQTEILKEKLKNYQMSVTHLNNFLDLYYGEGPMKFYEDTILRFPRKPEESLSFGNAFHKAIEEIIKYTNVHKKHPPFTHIYETFQQEIYKDYYGLVEEEKAALVKAGEEPLQHYYEKEIHNFQPGDQSEIDFARERLTLTHPDNLSLTANITGKIDYLRKTPTGEYEILDFKTGESFSKFDFNIKDDAKKLKMIKYRDQLLFYKILLKNSPEYKNICQNLKLGIQFVQVKDSEIEDNQDIRTVYLSSEDISEEEIERMEKLIVNVYQKIISRDLPDISKFAKSAEGVEDFREFLINNK